MVAEESVELLRELGELKFYHLAQYGEADQIERRHGEFANRLANPVESVRNESRGHSNERDGETGRQLLARDANNLKTSSIAVSRVFKVKETTTTTEVTSGSNKMSSVASLSATNWKGPTLAVAGKDLATSSMFQNECPPGDMLATPGRSVQKLCTAHTDTKDGTPPRSSNPKLLTSASETRPTKTKTFFGRNRVRPKQRLAGNSNRYLPPLGGNKLVEETTAQGTEESEMKLGTLRAHRTEITLVSTIGDAGTS